MFHLWWCHGGAWGFISQTFKLVINIFNFYLDTPLHFIFDIEYWPAESNQIGLGKRSSRENCKPAVFLQAPTGIGKTTLICELLKEYKEKYHNKKPLYLVNRTALRIQIKRKLLKSDEKISHLCNRNGKMDLELLDSYDEIAGIEVITYHKFLLKKSFEYKNYSVIVADEAHFLCSDSLFCPDTYSILRKICENFGDIPRIYITATDTEVLGVIAQYEKYVMLDCDKDYEFLGKSDELKAKRNVVSGIIHNTQNIIDSYNATHYDNRMEYYNYSESAQFIKNRTSYFLPFKIFYYSLKKDNKNYRLFPIGYKEKDKALNNAPAKAGGFSCNLKLRSG